MRKVALIDLAVCSGLCSFIFAGVVALSSVRALEMFEATNAFAQSTDVTSVGDKVSEDGKKGKDEKDSEPAVLEPGVIASAGSSNSRSVGLDANLNTGLTDAKLSPIAASVSSANGRCLVSVTNTSKKNSYTISYSVEGYDGNSRKFSKGFGSTLAPSKSASHDFACEDGLALRVALRKGIRKK